MSPEKFRHIVRHLEISATATKMLREYTSVWDSLKHGKRPCWGYSVGTFGTCKLGRREAEPGEVPCRCKVGSC